jgi:hypothetical protein
VGHPIGDPARLLYDVLYNLGFPVLGFAFFSGAYLVRHRSRLGLFLLVSGVVPIVALEAVSPFVFAEDRYAMVTLPAWIFLAALGMRELWRQVAAGPARLLVGGIGSALVLTSLVVLVPYYTVDEGQQADWRGAFALVDSRRAPADVVVTTQPEVASYYLPVPVERFDDLSPAGIVATRARHWFILDARTRWATPGLKAWLEENGTLLAILPRRVPQDQTLFVYRYDPLEHATGSDETL